MQAQPTFNYNRAKGHHIPRMERPDKKHRRDAPRWPRITQTQPITTSTSSNRIQGHGQINQPSRDECRPPSKKRNYAAPQRLRQTRGHRKPRHGRPNRCFKKLVHCREAHILWACEPSPHDKPTKQDGRLHKASKSAHRIQSAKATQRREETRCLRSIGATRVCTTLSQ